MTRAPLLRWAVLDDDDSPVGPLHDTRHEAETAARFLNRHNPGLRSTTYRPALLRIEIVGDA